MGVSRKGSWPYAEALLSRPARRLPVVLRRGKSGVTLLHEGRALTRCYDNAAGRLATALVAQALGVPVPPEGGNSAAEVSTGVLYRAISLSSLDPRMSEARPLIDRLLGEAEEQRHGASDAE